MFLSIELSYLICILTFQEGDDVELIDSMYRLRVRPACIRRVIGSRIWVFVSKEYVARPTIIKSDPQVESLLYASEWIVPIMTDSNF